MKHFFLTSAFVMSSLACTRIYFPHSTSPISKSTSSVLSIVFSINYLICWSRAMSGRSCTLTQNDIFVGKRKSLIRWKHCILTQYKKASGQMLNKVKTSLFFSKNTPTNVKHNITLIAGVKAHGSFQKYLGLPAIMEKNKTRCFQNLVYRT